MSKQLTRKTLVEPGENFNKLKYSSVSSSIPVMNKLMEEDPATRKTVEKLIKIMEKS